MASFTIHGEPASKANSRKLVFNKHTRRPMFIKSEKALSYSESALPQIPCLNPIITGQFLRADFTMYYATMRPDMDESLLLDLMQGRIYENDRYVRERHVYGVHLDRENPRVDVAIYVIEL